VHMGKKRDQEVVNAIAEDLIRKLKLVFLLDGPEKELFLQMGADEEEVGRGSGWLYFSDFAEVEEVRKAVDARIGRLRTSTLGQIVSTARGMTVIAHEEMDGDPLLRGLALATILRRMYDLLDRDQQPYVREYPDPD
jgi:hypothetical protein